MPSMQAGNLRGETTHLEVNALPDRCPRCHAHLQPKFLGAVAKFENREQVTAMWQCTRSACQEAFLTYYRFYMQTQGKASEYQLAKSVPMSPVPAPFSPEVKEVSASFVAIYEQAIAAEAAGLDQLTGIGLRKALEFLIKDFLIAERPADKAKIESSLLGVCIDSFVDDARLKACAKRAAWLGNDETHYVRRWTDRDLVDLKTLVRLTALWIESVRLTKKYENEMKSGGA